MFIIPWIPGERSHILPNSGKLWKSLTQRTYRLGGDMFVPSRVWVQYKHQDEVLLVAMMLALQSGHWHNTSHTVDLAYQWHWNHLFPSPWLSKSLTQNGEWFMSIVFSGKTLKNHKGSAQFGFSSTGFSTEKKSKVPTCEPRKDPSYFPLYCLVNRDPYNG